MKKNEYQNATGTPTLHNDDDRTTTGAAHHDEEMHSWRRDPAPLAVDHARFLLTMTPVPTSSLPACVLWPPPSILRSNLDHDESPFCTALSNLNVWNLGAIERVTSEYRCMVLVPRWCSVYRRYSMHICGTCMNTLNLVVSYECGVCGWEYFQSHLRVYPYSIYGHDEAKLSGSWPWSRKRIFKILFLTSAKIVIVLSLTLKYAHGFKFVQIWFLSNSNLNILLVTQWWAETVQTWTSGDVEG